MREMKDSGIEWIGEIPKEWKLRKIKFLPNNEENSFVDGDWIESPVITDEGIRYYTTGNIGDGLFKEQGNGYISLNTFKMLNCKYAYPGDLVISRLNAPYGRSCILPNNEEKYVLAVDNVILRTNEDKKFICYLTQCLGYQRAVEDISNGTTMKRVSRVKLGNISLPLPRIDLQNKIANYLDTKCSEIDATAEDIQKEISLLEDYKKSVITEAVTKGLNPDAEMKDSGIEWIGEIPKGWKVPKIKYVAKFLNGDRGKNYPSGNDLTDSGIVFLTSNNIRGVVLDCTSDITKYITEKRYNILGGAKIRKNDIIFCLRGSVGNCAINKTENEGTIASSLVDIRSIKVVASFLNYCLKSDINSIQTSINMTGSCAANLSAENVANYCFIEPSISEQQQIADYLDSKCSEIDTLIVDKKRQLDILAEYKKSLIYEYVTGKKEVPVNE